MVVVVLSKRNVKGIFNSQIQSIIDRMLLRILLMLILMGNI